MLSTALLVLAIITDGFMLLALVAFAAIVYDLIADIIEERKQDKRRK